ncbi:MAG: polysaccharide biosynthesis C-terminal domain-containing protein, partial [Verrucomicrobiales bacterium]|nr:polysaccharide biosynthesis C-terminal domain-containing protein [Verrucomicrobiales bacterium]
MNFETVYFQVSLISVAPQLIAIAAANFFIGIQRTGVAMIGSICGMVANVVCNYALIFGAFGVPKLGFVGAA